MNALANEEVGKFLNKYCVSSFQRVGTFKINKGAKQGGNVASYFCVPDGRVLHVIPGPVNAAEFLEEARWVLKKTQQGIAESKRDATKFKQQFRRFHAQRLQEKYGAKVTPILEDNDLQSRETALAYRDRDGRRLAPVLTLPVIEDGAKASLNNTAKANQLLAAHALIKIENLYGAVFQGILNERVSTRPVQSDTPFPWDKKK